MHGTTLWRCKLQACIMHEHMYEHKQTNSPLQAHHHAITCVYGHVYLHRHRHRHSCIHIRKTVSVCTKTFWINGNVLCVAHLTVTQCIKKIPQALPCLLAVDNPAHGIECQCQERNVVLVGIYKLLQLVKQLSESNRILQISCDWQGNREMMTRIQLTMKQ